MEGCLDCNFENGQEFCSKCYNDGYVLYEKKCIRYSDEKCLSCLMKNE